MVKCLQVSTNRKFEAVLIDFIVFLFSPFANIILVWKLQEWYPLLYSFLTSLLLSFIHSNTLTKCELINDLHCWHFERKIQAVHALNEELWLSTRPLKTKFDLNYIGVGLDRKTKTRCRLSDHKQMSRQMTWRITWHFCIPTEISLKDYPVESYIEIWGFGSMCRFFSKK